MRPQRLAVGTDFIRELIDVRLCMLFPSLGPGLIFGFPALLHLALESIEFARRLTELIGEEFNRRVLQFCFRQTWRKQN